MNRVVAIAIVALAALTCVACGESSGGQGVSERSEVKQPTVVSVQAMTTCLKKRLRECGELPGRIQCEPNEYDACSANGVTDALTLCAAYTLTGRQGRDERTPADALEMCNKAWKMNILCQDGLTYGLDYKCEVVKYS